MYWRRFQGTSGDTAAPCDGTKVRNLNGSTTQRQLASQEFSLQAAVQLTPAPAQLPGQPVIRYLNRHSTCGMMPAIGRRYRPQEAMMRKRLFVRADNLPGEATGLDQPRLVPEEATHLRAAHSHYRRAAKTILAVALALFCGGNSPAARQDDGVVIFDMDSTRHTPTTSGEEKTPVGKVEVVPGRFGNACRFEFTPDTRSGFFTAGVKASPGWDRAAGISFWVKGDGSANFGGLELIDGSDYSLRYGYCFPIDSTEWRKISVPWCDLIPELPAGRLVNPDGGYVPSNFGNIWFGKWYYWREYPACSFTVDQIVLEPSIPMDRTD